MQEYDKTKKYYPRLLIIDDWCNEFLKAYTKTVQLKVPEVQGRSFSACGGNHLSRMIVSEWTIFRSASWTDSFQAGEAFYRDLFYSCRLKLTSNPTRLCRARHMMPIVTHRPWRCLSLVGLCLCSALTNIAWESALIQLNNFPEDGGTIWAKPAFYHAYVSISTLTLWTVYWLHWCLISSCTRECHVWVPSPVATQKYLRLERMWRTWGGSHPTEHRSFLDGRSFDTRIEVLLKVVLRQCLVHWNELIRKWDRRGSDL